MSSQSKRWIACSWAAVLTLAGCGGSTVQLGDGVRSPDGTRYYWTTAESTGSRRLWREGPAAGELVLLDEGTFANVIGPLPSPGGVAWGVLAEDGWAVHQIGVSDAVVRRSQGVSDALSAAWLLERLANGHPPGNAADLVAVGVIARSGRWPE
jgi:hypothetical protein